jgi:hypothetical protein
MPALREILAQFGINFPTQAVDQADKSIEGLVGNVRSLAATLAGGLVLNSIKTFVSELTTQADALAKQSAAIGLSAEELQAWNHAAGLSGIAANEFTNALGKLQKKAADAIASATGPGAVAFKDLGVEVKNADGSLRSITELMDDVADGMARIENPTERTAIAMALFEETGPRFINLFAQGSEKMRAMRAEVEALGGGFTNEFAKASEEVNDQLSRLGLVTLSLKVRLAQALLPSIRFVTDKLIGWGKVLLPVVKNSEALHAILGVIGSITLARAWKMLLQFTGGLRGLLGLLVRLTARILIPFLLLEDLFTFLAGGDTLIGRALDKAFGPGTAAKIQGFFKLMSEDSAKAFDALRAKGDEIDGWWGGLVSGMATAAQVAWNIITGDWKGAVEQLKIVGDGLLLAINILWTEITGGAALAAAGIMDAFAPAWNSILDAVKSVRTAIADLLDMIPGLGGAAAGIRKLAGGTDAHRMDTDSTAQVRRGIEIERLQLASDFDKIVARQNALNDRHRAQPQSVTVHNETTVQVPPGTPVEQARAVSKAAERGAQRGTNLRAVQAALVPGAG